MRVGDGDVAVDRLLQRYRSPFVGKSSPVLFWWGSFDLSETRFSGRPALKREWPARWMALGADQEQAAAGFWPGSGSLLAPAYYAYTVPAHPDLSKAQVRPDRSDGAHFDKQLGEFIFLYDDVRKAADPSVDRWSALASAFCLLGIHITTMDAKDTKAELLRFGNRPALQAGWHGRIGWIDEHYSPRFVRRSIRVRPCASRRDAAEPQ